MRSIKLLATLLLVMGTQLSALGAEVAVLRNAFRISFNHKEEMGAITRLYMGQDSSSYLDIQTDTIASFEKDETPAPEPVSAQIPAPAAATITQPATPAKVDLDQLVRDASSKRQIDPDFINSVIKAESNFHPRAVSPKGAQGLMQLMPDTAARLGVNDPFDPKANVEAGTAYLSELLTLYNNDPIKALAAYNAGAHRVEQYHGVPPYRETRAYITRIVKDFNAKKLAQMKAAKTQAAAPAAKKPNSAKTAKSGAAKQRPVQQASAATTQSSPAAE